MSAAVMPMRKIVSALAARGSAADTASASIPAVTKARPVPHFLVRIAVKSFSLFCDYFLCNCMQRLCQGR
jgi:hypothetical protein